MNKPSYPSVQTSITAVSFPDTMENFFKMLEKHEESYGYLGTDLDSLIKFSPTAGVFWTAPVWITSGDILFFYQSMKARPRIKKLLKEARQNKIQRKYVKVLEDSLDLVSRYSGTIFGCAKVAGSSEYISDKAKLQHFKGRIFAPLSEVYIFNSPLSIERFTSFVKLSPGGTITPLYNEAARKVKEELGKYNVLPNFLEEVEFSKFGFREINKTNWRSISCAADTHFINEDQLRAFFLDFLLAELKDSNTPLLEECQCFKNDQKSGFADYFITIYGNWIPVEAKRNILAEKDLFSQISQYTQIDYFIPTKGSNKGKCFKGDFSGKCLVVDQSGIYFTNNGQFVDCDWGTPKWKREHLKELDIKIIRKTLEALVVAN
jgi:hypothetical protein